MNSSLKVLNAYGIKAVDLSRKNRLLKFSKNAKSITFNMNLETFIAQYNDKDSLLIEFSHHQIMHSDNFNPNSNPNDAQHKKASIPPTDLQGEKLITSLNALRLEAKRSYEEHGLITLFLTIGKVKWKEPSVGSEHSSNTITEYDYNAPLLLIPINIEEKKNPKKTIITGATESDDINFNNVLNLLLEQEYNASTIKFDYHENTDSLLFAYQKLCVQINKVFTEINLKFEITHEIQIGQYFFFGQQIYQDLYSNQNKIIEHAFISALCSHSQLSQKNLDIKIENPDALLHVESDFNVMDADSSQLQVIQHVINENHLNIQGPPGTGKSQTIVNVIANLLARKKTVLVVSEKQVALQVVLERLKKTNLDKLCLPLFHYNADKKVFAKSIIEDRENIIRLLGNQKTQDLNAPHLDRTKKINVLKNYAKELNEIIRPLSKTLYWVHGEFIKHKNISYQNSISWRGSNPLEIDFDEYASLMSILDKISPVFNIALERNIDHWRLINKQHFAPDTIDRINEGLKTLRDVILSGEKIASSFAYPGFDSIETMLKILKYQNSINEIPAIYKLHRLSFDEISQAINTSTSPIDCSKQLNSPISSILNKNNISFSWNVELINDLDKYISNSTSIIQVQNAASDSLELKKWLDRINQIIENINLTFSCQYDIDELLISIDIFQLDPIIKNINGWTNKCDLQFIFEQLNELDISTKNHDDVNKILRRWKIVPLDINPREALSINERFKNKYNGAFRYLYPQYYKDCKLIAKWCKADIPVEYAQYLEISIAVASYLNYPVVFESSLNKFNKLYVQQKSCVDPKQIPILLININKVLNWLDEHGHVNVPEKILQLMNNTDSTTLIHELCDIIKKVYNLLNFSWNIFQPDKTSSIKKIIQLYPLLQQSILNNLGLFKAICLLYRVELHQVELQSCSISELKNQAFKINGTFLLLSSSLHNPKTDQLFGDVNTIKNFLNDNGDLQEFLAHMNNITAIVNLNIHTLPENITVNKGIKYNSELQKILPIIHEWNQKYKQTLSELNYLFGSDDISSHWATLTFTDYKNIIETMLNDNVGLEKYLEYRRFAYQLETKGYKWFLENTQGQFVVNPTSLFAKSLWSTWLEKYYALKPALQNFEPKDHKNIIHEFEKLEQLIMKINSLRILEKYEPMFSTRNLGGEKERVLLHQSQLKMRHKPIRKLVQETGEHLLKSKPCWMMSPLTLSSYIPYGRLEFDVVIFDEASQMRVEHALGAIARAKQVLIFGDENQLPPSSFFQIPSDSQTDEEMTEDYESILHATKEILPGANYILSYHYRSKYEDLIAFSNHYVYDDRLTTFPNANKLHKAVLFEYVENGLFDGGSSGNKKNDIEAQRVVEVCIKKVTEEPNKSLGVISFSKTQEVAIRDALQSYLKKNPQFQSLLDETSDVETPFFIKNLESVQGDERDIIILSVGYGRDKRTGVMYNRFGPINGQYGYRRLNVAVTRAKEQIICVSSIKSSDIRNSKESRGAYLLQKYLEYAEKGITSFEASLLVQNQIDIQADSTFEEEVEKALQMRGFIVHRQIGASGFKIDLAIVNPNNEQEYILGIECDGAAYHSSYSARMNDRIRQDILERLGWRLYRVWSQHWISRKEDIIEDIIRKVSDA